MSKEDPTETKKLILRGRLSADQQNRLRSLHDMPYRPSEIAEELDINVRQFYRVYKHLGYPHHKDSNGKIWINGHEFCEWYLSVYKKVKPDKDEAVCLTCQKAVKIVDPKQEEKNGLVYLLCHCPHCNRCISHIVTDHKPNYINLNDQLR
ncbi:MAG TPA: hypothetical protein VLL52_05935 [Anaerolineae bacterium]|nr:hypothetical protein [Anaerolineae bacterium]